MEPIDTDAFEALVADALEEIPDQLRAEMENVAIIIDDESPPGRLYGLYEGIPLTKRGTYGGASPDRITLFLATICRSARTPDELARRVRVTVLHEVGHHFGEFLHGSVAIVYGNYVDAHVGQSECHSFLDVAIIVGYQDLCHVPSSRLPRARIA